MRCEILFTDIDGTLLDQDYSFDVSLPLISSDLKCHLIFCTTKTRAEVEYYRKIFGVRDPFIVENGSAIYIPEDYFSLSADEMCDVVRDACDDVLCDACDEACACATDDAINAANFDVRDGYIVVELAGAEGYDRVRRALKEIARDTMIEIRGFGDMSTRELADVSGLRVELAALAKRREYSESFLILAQRASSASPTSSSISVSVLDSEDVRAMIEEASKRGFRISHGGRFFTIYGKNVDKGRAVRVLKALFARECGGNMRTYGIGDSANDIPMLAAVDITALVRREDGSSCVEHAPEPLRSRIHVTEKIGPEGFVEFIRKYLM